jgi:hypothetical protein
MGTSRDKVAQMWHAHFDAARLKWYDPITKAAAQLQLDADRLAGVLTAVGVWSHWPATEKMEACSDAIEMSRCLLQRLEPRRAVLPGTKAVLPQWFGWYNDEKRIGMMRVVEECLRVRVVGIKYGTRAPTDEQECHYIEFGEAL